MLLTDQISKNSFIEIGIMAQEENKGMDEIKNNERVKAERSENQVLYKG